MKPERTKEMVMWLHKFSTRTRIVTRKSEKGNEIEKKKVFDLYVENLDEYVIKEMKAIVRDVNP